MSDLSQFMERAVKKVRPEATLLQAATLMRRAGASYVVVEERGKAVGILTEADLARRAIPARKNPAKVKVRALMSRPVVSVDIKTTMRKVNAVMKAQGIRHLVITQKSKMAGMITMLGLLRYFIKKSQR